MNKIQTPNYIPRHSGGYFYLSDADGNPRPATKLDQWYDEVFVNKKSIITGENTTNKYINW